MKSLDNVNPQVIYCDNHLFVVHKPNGMLVQDELVLWGKKYLKETFSKPGQVFLEPIHRLDRVTSGLVIFARTSKALTRLNEAVRSRQFQKHYYAILEGELLTEGKLEHYLIHSSHHAKVAKVHDPHAKLSILSYRILGRGNGLTAVAIHLETGRYHQIRVQFSTLGYPILGDKQYGSKKKDFHQGIALHHAACTICHPIQNQMLTFTSSPPYFFHRQGCFFS